MIKAAPILRKKTSSSARTFSSSKNFCFLLICSIDDYIILTRKAARVFQSRANMNRLQARKNPNYFPCVLPGGEHCQNLPNHDPGASKYRLAVADRWIGGDVFVDIKFRHNQI